MGMTELSLMHTDRGHQIVLSGSYALFCLLRHVLPISHLWGCWFVHNQSSPFQLVSVTPFLFFYHIYQSLLLSIIRLFHRLRIMISICLEYPQNFLQNLLWPSIIIKKWKHSRESHKSMIHLFCIWHEELKIVFNWMTWITYYFFSLFVKILEGKEISESNSSKRRVRDVVW